VAKEDFRFGEWLSLKCVYVVMVDPIFLDPGTLVIWPEGVSR